MLTIVRGWVLEDRPGLAEATDRSDDFMEWTGSLRAMLQWAGFPGTFGGSSQKVVIAADPDTDEWAGFLAAIHDGFGGNPFTVKDLVLDLGSVGGVDPDALPGPLADRWSRLANTYGAGSKAGFSKSLGKWFLNRAGRYADGWKVEKVESTGDKHAHGWRVIAP